MIGTPKDLTFRAIGRNIVNFQKLESCLKFLARYQELSGTFTQVSHAVTRSVEQSNRLTMGGAVGAWSRVARGQSNAIPTTPDLFEMSITISYGPFMAEPELSRHAAALAKLNEERNRLVHHDLAAVDYTSEVLCNQLLERLDAQNKEILEQLGIVAIILTELKEFAEWANEPENVSSLVEGLSKALNEDGT